jgi:MFS family permease
MSTQSGSGFYYGWIIAIASGLILVITNGMTLAGLNVFDKPMLEELGDLAGAPVRLDAFKLRDAITLTASGLLAPLAGALADRFGVRPLMILGGLLLSVGYFLYSRVDSLADIYGIHVIFASALAACGLVVNVILISRWFVTNRGLALGIALAGTSLGNGTLPPINAALMAELGWRDAFMWSSLLPLLVIPIVLFIVRERPADKGLVAPGSEMVNGKPADLTGMVLREAVKTRNFWILALVAMFTFFSIIGTQAHLNLFMLAQGFSQMDAGYGYTVLFYLGLVGKLLSGFLADRFGHKPIFVGTLSFMLAGGLVFAAGPDGKLLWLGLSLFGLGWGGLYTLLQLLAADYFGPRHLGKILGAITVLDTTGGGLGPAVIGTIRESTGTYLPAFGLVAGLIFLATVLASRFQVPARARA